MGAQPLAALRHGMDGLMRLAFSQRPVRGAQSLVLCTRQLCRGLVLADYQHACVWIHAPATRHPGAHRIKCLPRLVCQLGGMACALDRGIARSACFLQLFFKLAF